MPDSRLLSINPSLRCHTCVSLSSFLLCFDSSCVSSASSDCLSSVRLATSAESWAAFASCHGQAMKKSQLPR